MAKPLAQSPVSQAEVALVQVAFCNALVRSNGIIQL